MNEQAREAVVKILQNCTASRFWSDREAWGEITADQILSFLKGLVPSTCAYCGKPPDAAMLTMGDFMAHDTCVIRKLNELLDPDYHGTNDPARIVAKVPELTVLSDAQIDDIGYPLLRRGDRTGSRRVAQAQLEAIKRQIEEYNG